jgi:hypothetical protein
LSPMLSRQRIWTKSPRSVQCCPSNRINQNPAAGLAYAAVLHVEPERGGEEEASKDTATRSGRRKTKPRKSDPGDITTSTRWQDKHFLSRQRNHPQMTIISWNKAFASTPALSLLFQEITQQSTAEAEAEPTVAATEQEKIALQTQEDPARNLMMLFDSSCRAFDFLVKHRR